MGSPFHGEAATSPRSGNAGVAVRANSIVKPACMVALLTVAAIRKKIRATNVFRSRVAPARPYVQPKRCSRWRIKCGETAWANGSGSRSRWSRVASAGLRRRSRAISPATPIRYACNSALGDRLLLRAAGGAVLEGAVAAQRTGPPSPPWASVSSACSSCSTTSQCPTRPPRAPASRWRHCRCTPW